MQLALVGALLLAAACAQPAAAAGPVKAITEATFPGEVLGPMTDSLVVLNMPGCGKCDEFGPELAQAAAAMEGDATLTFLTQDVAAHNVPPQVARIYAARSFPAVYLALRGGGGKWHPVAYAGARTAGDLVAWIAKQRDAARSANAEL
jgi:thioredoxin-like negative regulator of GroEL